jgi:protein-L-isoaspartate O-methyltransferase
MNKDFFKKIYSDIQKYKNLDISNLLKFLQNIRKDFSEKEYSLILSEFISNEKKYQNKFPNLIHAGGLLYGKVCEQATDEAVATHKATFFQGSQFLDLTAGLGIDTMAFAKKFHSVTAIEPEPDLLSLLQFNTEQLHMDNIHCILSSAEQFLAFNTLKYDLIYIDPSRKIQNQKVYHPKDCSPNVLILLPHLFSFSSQILIKLSPMIEIQELPKWFHSIEWIWIISKENECKEVLVLLNKNYNGNPNYRLSLLHKNECYVYEWNFHPHLSNDTSNDDFHFYQYVLLPDVAFNKAHALNYLAYLTHGKLTSEHDGFLFLKEIPQNYYGRIKKILKIIDLKDFEDYQRKQHLWNAQVIRKHFPMKVEEIRKKWKITEGKECLIFYQWNKKNQVVHCQDIISN